IQGTLRQPVRGGWPWLHRRRHHAPRHATPPDQGPRHAEEQGPGKPLEEARQHPAVSMKVTLVFAKMAATVALTITVGACIRTNEHTTLPPITASIDEIRV